MKKKNIDFQRPSDSLFTHFFARSLSVHITPLFAKTPITPLHVTIASLLFGLCAAWLGSIPRWSTGIVAAVLMELSHTLDCVDGELARFTGKGNPFAASLDPISDRIKDMAVIFAAFLQSHQLKVFSLSDFFIFSIAFLTCGLWLLYMYIVDSFLNPSRIKTKTNSNKPHLYLGLYDLFIYGSVTFWLLHVFEYFLFYVLCMSIIGLTIQLYRLKKHLSLSN